jgi:hypothetical protein
MLCGSNWKVVEELIWSGRMFSDIAVEETGVGYLSPDEWSSELSLEDDGSCIVLDLRTRKVSSFTSGARTKLF